MALNAYLTLKGQKQGEIHGSVTQKGREGRIQVIAVEHEIISPRDAASGLATGKRQHKPFIITKELDKSSPLLYQALASNERFSEWELQFYAPLQAGPGGAGGMEVQRFTVKLTNAAIADIKFQLPNTKNPDYARYAEFEQIAFVYGSIQWIWRDGDVTAQDNWAGN